MSSQSIKEIQIKVINTLYTNIYVKDLCQIIFTYCLSVDSFIINFNYHGKYDLQLNNDNCIIIPHQTYVQFMMKKPLVMLSPYLDYNIVSSFSFFVDHPFIETNQKLYIYIIMNGFHSAPYNNWSGENWTSLSSHASDPNILFHKKMFYDVDYSFEIHSLKNFYICKSFLTYEFLFLI